MFRIRRSPAVPRLLALVVIALAVQPAAADGPKGRQKLYITNSAGNDVTIVDVATNKVLANVEVGPHPHGIAVPASQDLLLITIEGGKQGELVYFDPFTDKVTKR